MTNVHGHEQNQRVQVYEEQKPGYNFDKRRKQIEDDVKKRIQVVYDLLSAVCKRFRYDDIRIEINELPDLDGALILYKLKLTRSVSPSKLSDDIIKPICGYLIENKFKFGKIPNYYDEKNGLIEMNFYDETSQLPKLVGRVSDRSGVGRK